MTRRQVSRRAPRDPYGLAQAAPYVPPILATLALFVVGVMTWNLMNGQLPFRGGSGPGGGPDPVRTPAPSNVIVVPEIEFPGAIVYAKTGNIWIQEGEDVRQLTDSGMDSMPSFSSDGTWVYYIREIGGKSLFPLNGQRTWFDMAVPVLRRVNVESGADEGIVDGRYRSGQYTWFYWMRTPAPAPDGKTIAVISDGPNPTQSDVVLQLYDLETRAFTRLDVAQSAPLGHQDPAWRPDGLLLAYVRNGRSGTLGTPQIMRYDVRSGKAAAVTGPGYLSPAFSPDGNYLAATRTDSFGTDVVIIDAKTGLELLRVTNDDHSFSPVWSPAGDALAFLRLEGVIVDLHMVPLEGQAGRWTPGEEVALTEISGLDAGSRPSWFVPASELPPPPTPSASAAPSGSAPTSTSP